MKYRHSMPLSPRISVYRWRAPMIASLAHRASGLLLVAIVPFYIWLLSRMTGSPEDFDAAVEVLHSPFVRLLLLAAGIAFVYHFCNGIRFLMLDAGWFESHANLRFSAWLVLTLAALAALLLAGLLL